MSLFDLPPEITKLEDADDAIVVVQSEGAVVLMTKAAEELLGVSSEDMVGEFVEMLVPEKKRWGHQAYRRGYLAEPADREMDPGLYPEAERPDGTIVPIAARLEPIRINGELYVAAHVSEREREPEELAEMQQSSE
ncbi:MAG: domain S-box protein [Acidimicrobiales bacterium]|nr:domain S-box protein [Acidimicrobiales bacterium]